MLLLRADNPQAVTETACYTEALVSANTNKKVNTNTSAPKNKESFGNALWLVLVEDDSILTEVAKRLGVSKTTLSAIIHSRQNTSQRMLRDRRWREVLAECCPKGWKKHGKLFEKWATTLNESGGRKTFEPEDKKSIGYVLWHILGGKNAKLSKAALHLGLAQSALSAIIHGNYQLTLQDVVDKKLPEKLAEHYPDGWSKLCKIFELLAQEQSGIEVNWKQAAGEFADRVIKESGDEIGDLKGDISIPALKNENTWKLIFVGNETTPKPVFVNAVKELCRLYHLAANRPELFVEAEVLIACNG